ncbi:MAG: hypothetical protein KJ077_50260 [Anaerolineae bacterium]|nr:hypothetical protein [Anaerolineae bacterium]
MSTTKKPNSLFSPGRVIYPPRVQRALRRAGVHGVSLLARHLTGEWGQVDLKRSRVNRWAIAHRQDHNKPVISRFPLSPEERILIITRRLHTPGRRETTFILSREAEARPRPKTELVRRRGRAKSKRERQPVKAVKPGRVK